jgi:hypothetical protein
MKAFCFTTLLMLATIFSATAHGAEPIIDNEQVTVWDTTSPLPPARNDFVSVSLTRKGTAVLGHKGEIPGEAGARTVVIELKGHPEPPLENHSGYPLAFPRARVVKLLETDKLVVWSYRWNRGEPTPMHFHDKNLVVVFEDDMALKSTAVDGQSILNEYKFGTVRYNLRGRVHTETLLTDSGSAVITELK